MAVGCIIRASLIHTITYCALCVKNSLKEAVSRGANGVETDQTVFGLFLYIREGGPISLVLFLFYFSFLSRLILSKFKNFSIFDTLL